MLGWCCGRHLETVQALAALRRDLFAQAVERVARDALGVAKLQARGAPWFKS